MMKLLITLDYELYNGKFGGTVENCIIKPTMEFIKVLDKHSMKAVFFVDTVFLNRLLSLKENNTILERDWESIKQQLIYLHNHGHDLQLHLHPQWYHGSFEEGKWRSVLSDYKLSDMPTPLVEEMFKNGITLLNGFNNNNTIAFRAGAYCLQTLGNYNEILYNNGLRIDSSVNRNGVSKTQDHQWYDFSRIPDEYVYPFWSDVTVKEPNGQLLEVSIPSYKLSIIEDILNHIRRRINKDSKKTWGDGIGSIGHYDNKKDKMCHMIKSRFKPMRVVASIDACGAETLECLFSQETRRGGEYMMIMGHPKSFTPYSLNLLDKFLAKHNGELETCVISDYYITK